MAKSNKRLVIARAEKFDEFYTLYSDIEDVVSKVLEKCGNVFEGKVIYCPCDSDKSNFTQFLLNNFERLKLKELICTSYSRVNKGKIVHKLGTSEVYQGDLEGDGDFNSEECRKYWEKADLIFSNPPFSLASSFYRLIKASGCDFLFISNFNVIKQQAFQNDYIAGVFEFSKLASLGMFEIGSNEWQKATKDGPVKIVAARWCSNFWADVKPSLFLDVKPENYMVEYDNIHAREIPITRLVPNDYDGYMGIPISSCDFNIREHFDIIGLTTTLEQHAPHLLKDCELNRKKGKVFCRGKELYARLIIKKKPEAVAPVKY